MPRRHPRQELPVTKPILQFLHVLAGEMSKRRIKMDLPFEIAGSGAPFKVVERQRSDFMVGKAMKDLSCVVEELEAKRQVLKARLRLHGLSDHDDHVILY